MCYPIPRLVAFHANKTDVIFAYFLLILSILLGLLYQFAESEKMLEEALFGRNCCH